MATNDFENVPVDDQRRKVRYKAVSYIKMVIKILCRYIVPVIRL